ncbi:MULTISPECIES: hypothetical protein [Moorena]|uniref:Uncharacterized protein n=1 Tax=Moorena producens (strain JHB) TaxID=1454205 RepID=A0A9Q9UVN2_MOOP1|nr:MULTISPECIES: hypothetical protein [Moorena]WAN69003.1 hypothetical protein BJP36_42330 [Moorena producens JHB]
MGNGDLRVVNLGQKATLREQSSTYPTPKAKGEQPSNLLTF